MKEETPDEIFDKVSDNFKLICTKDGINRQAVIDFLINIAKLLPDDEKPGFAEEVGYQSAIFCGANYYETIGIIEAVKLRYNDTYNMVMYEENEDEDDDDNE